MKVITYTKPVFLDKNTYPKSYLSFLRKYGYGTYCDLLNFLEPDEHLIHSTFSDFDLWEFDSNFTKEDLKNAVQICSSNDGDILSFLKNQPSNLFLLPRHSEVILKFKTLYDVFDFYNKSYKISDQYFEPSKDRNIELFSLINNGRLLDINAIHGKFSENFNYDFTIGLEQPKYVIATMGGWVKFDLVYKNSITISYQTTETQEHSKYISFIKKEIDTLSK